MLYGLFLYRARIDTHLHTHVYTYVSRLARALVCYIYRYERRAANEFFFVFTSFPFFRTPKSLRGVYIVRERRAAGCDDTRARVFVGYGLFWGYK